MNHVTVNPICEHVVSDRARTTKHSVVENLQELSWMAFLRHGFVVSFGVADADESEFKAVVVFAEIASPTDE